MWAHVCAIAHTCIWDQFSLIFTFSRACLLLAHGHLLPNYRLQPSLCVLLTFAMSYHQRKIAITEGAKLRSSHFAAKKTHQNAWLEPFSCLHVVSCYQIIRKFHSYAYLILSHTPTTRGKCDFGGTENVGFWFFSKKVKALNCWYICSHDFNRHI